MTPSGRGALSQVPSCNRHASQSRRTPCLLHGAQVFYWQAQGAAGRFCGRRLRQFDRWRGPGTVIGREMRDGQEREGYWVSHAGHLRLIAPQHLRPAAREEQVSERDAIRRLNKIVDELSTRDQLVYENLIGQDDPDEIEVPAGDDHDDSAPRGHRSHASSSMLDPNREPEHSMTVGKLENSSPKDQLAS